ncbi:MAG: hypothetical protein L0H19_03660 [Salinisphaera sp.]|nr:hypothetical protein [Salinisphaera sp.]
MFSLVLAALSLGFVVLLLALGIYYLGDSPAEAQIQAEAAKILNNGSQIRGAINLYKTEHKGKLPEGLDELVIQGYLKSVPQGDWAFASNAVLYPAVSSAVCEAINEKLFGDPDMPACSDTNNIGCCTTGE